MTGNYGDQILRRFRMFKPGMPSAPIFAPDLLTHIQAAGETYKRIVDAHPLSFAAFQQAPWYHYYLLALEQSQLALRSPFLDNDVVRINYRAPQSVLGDNIVRLRLIADGSPALRRIRTDMGAGGTGEAFPGALLRQYYNFTFKADYAYNHGMPQWMAHIDHRLAPLHLERLFLGWHKYHHFRVWYRDQLAGYLREILLDSRTLSRPYWQRVSLKPW